MPTPEKIEEAIAKAQRHFDKEGKDCGLSMEDFLSPRLFECGCTDEESKEIISNYIPSEQAA